MKAEDLPFVEPQLCYWSVEVTGDADEDYKTGVQCAVFLREFMKEIDEPLMLFEVLRHMIRQLGDKVGDDSISFGFLEEVGRQVIGKKT